MARTLPVDPRAPDEEVLDQALRVLREGGVLAYPTETFYGLGADARSEDACRRVFELKGRPTDKAFPCIISGERQLQETALRLEETVLTLARRFWPGPLTLVVPAREALSASSKDGGIAVRVSGLRLARELPDRLGAPITATSANLSGKPAATTAAEALSSFPSGVDLFLDGGPSPGGLPSTVVDAREIPPRLLREGRIPFADVIRALEMP